MLIHVFDLVSWNFTTFGVLLCNYLQQRITLKEEEEKKKKKVKKYHEKQFYDWTQTHLGKDHVWRD